MIVKCRYIDMLENEEWLNEMAQDGHAMDDFSLGLFKDVYSFEKCEPGEYIFRVMMLDNFAKHTKSIRYLRFLRESGVEHVGSNGNVVYLRKKADSGPFDIFTDRDSRLKYHKKMTRWYAFGSLAYPVILVIAVGIMILSRLLDISTEWWYAGVGMLVGAAVGGLPFLGIFIKCFQALRQHRKIVKRLKNEGLLYE